MCGRDAQYEDNVSMNVLPYCSPPFTLHYREKEQKFKGDEVFFAVFEIFSRLKIFYDAISSQMQYEYTI